MRVDRGLALRAGPLRICRGTIITSAVGAVRGAFVFPLPIPGKRPVFDFSRRPDMYGSAYQVNADIADRICSLLRVMVDTLSGRA
jgi:hypothetical protein